MKRILLMCLMSIPYCTLADMACSKRVLSGVSEVNASTPPATDWLNLRDTAYLRVIIYDNASSAVPSGAWRIESTDSKICTHDGIFQRCASITGSMTLDDQYHHLTYTTTESMQPGGATEQTAYLRLQFDSSRQIPYNPPYRILIQDSYSHVFPTPLSDTHSMEITTATWSLGTSYTFPPIGPGETTLTQMIRPPSGASGTLRRVSGEVTGVSVHFNNSSEEPDMLSISPGQSTQISMAATPDAEPGAYNRVYEATLNCP